MSSARIDKERDKRAWHLYATGMTLEEVGAHFGVTKMRACQIVARHPNPPNLRLAHRGSVQRRRKAAKRRACPQCGEWFTARKKTQRFCSVQCSRAKKGEAK